MHPTPAFRHEDAAFRQKMVRKIGFGMVFLTTPDGPRVAQTPMELSDSNTIRFHLARTNALVRHLDGATALAVVNGPDAYVSARWYEAANQVPTWNYVSFEFEGTIRRTEPAALPDLLARLSAHHETTVDHGTPWTMEKMDEKALAALLRGIVGFEMTIETVRETVKRSQNKPEAERNRVIAGLEKANKHAMAELMRDMKS